MTKRPLRVAGFMSGSGTNLRRLLEYADPAFEVVFLFSDNAASQTQHLALDYNLPYFIYDIRKFYEAARKPRRVDLPGGWQLRQQYDSVALKLLQTFDIDLIALGGYMSLLTLPFGAVNVHPGDLTLVDEKGRRILVGDHAVRDAILAGNKSLRASTLWVDQGVDSGPLLVLSDPLPISLPCPLAELKNNPRVLSQVADQQQNELKQKGDWRIFPLTVQLLALGRLQIKDGMAWLDGKTFPNGITLEQIHEA